MKFSLVHLASGQRGYAQTALPMAYVLQGIEKKIFAASTNAHPLMSVLSDRIHALTSRIFNPSRGGSVIDGSGTGGVAPS